MKKLVVIDLSNFIFRAFFAVRPLNAPDGTPVNAVHGILSMLMRLVTEHQPTHVLIARDTKGGSFRNTLYEDYKANRDEPPEDLVPQFGLIDRLVEEMKFPSVSLDNYEADDIIGSAVTQWKDHFDEVYIASGDKDLMQFVDDKVKMLDTMKNKILGRQEVFEKMGVYPEQIVDYLSMVGDSSDNIPGVKGIGAKGASKLLAEYQTLEKCLEKKEEIANKRAKNALIEYGEMANLSKKLVTIVCDLDLGVKVENSDFHFVPTQELIDYLKGLGFRSALKKLEELMPQVEELESGSDSKKSEAKDYDILQLKKPADIKKTISGLKGAIALTTYFQEDIGQTYSTQCQGVAFASTPEKVYFCSDFELVHTVLQQLVENKNVELVGSSLKRVVRYAQIHDFDFQATLFDVSLAEYVISASSRNKTTILSEKYLERVLPEFKVEQSDLFGADGAGLDSNTFALYCQTYLELKSILEEKIKELKLGKVFSEIDLPLLSILGRMEVQGVCFNKEYYQQLEKDFEKEVAKIRKKIEKEGKAEGVNLNSPKQVSELLFEKLELPVVKKTKTGFSTDSSVLEKLDLMGISPIPALILKYREYDKLLSTYIRPMPNYIDPVTSKIHARFNQMNAATGRLSSDHPNMQNIPVRTENGKKLRRGFVASPGNLLLSADYSQVELRLLAHFSEDEVMLEAFADGRDIHAQTAAEVFGYEIHQVTPEYRSRAKAINFGLMYGQSSFGLAEQLKISRKEAKEYITMYFARFSKVKSFLDTLVERCTETGYAETYFGRKRFLPDIKSNNRTMKAMAERVAINSPIQGTAADIIKLAMINIDRELKNRGLESKMVLQVHDELVFDVPEKELETMQELVPQMMENAVKLKVPLKVDAKTGLNLFDIK